jgi:protein associated with RNAse G/E
MLKSVDIRKMLVNGDQWAEWQGYHLPISDDYITLWTPIGTQMHWKPGTWISQKHSLMYFWDNERYVIHVSYHPDGSFASGYCDVVLPSAAYTHTSPEMIYVDLYIDVVINEDFTVYTKDQEVFEVAAHRYPLVREVREASFATLDWLEEHAKHWTGPFSVMPKSLPVTDFVQMQPEEAQARMQAILSQGS